MVICLFPLTQKKKEKEPPKDWSKDPTADQIIKLETSEGEITECKKQVACKSVLIKGVLDDNDEDAVPLPSVTKPILDKVLVYMNYISEPEKKLPKIKCPLVDADLKNSIEDHWYVDYVNIDKKHLYDVILAANFMDIKSLLKLTTAKVATYLKGKTLLEMRAEFGIGENDHGFSEEEYKQVLLENKWAEEAF